MENRLVGLDTNIFMAIFRKEDGYEAMSGILEKIERGELFGIISSIVLVENLILFYRENRFKEGMRALNLIQNISNLIIVDFSSDLVELSAELKVKYKLGLGDAIVLSAPVNFNADVFLTLDPDFNEVKEINVLTPKEFLEEFKGGGR